jgi:hypothetical protein
MAFIKRFRNGKPIDQTVPQQAPAQPQVPVQPIPIPPPSTPPAMIPPPVQLPHPPLPKVTSKPTPRRGGCGCGRK